MTRTTVLAVAVLAVAACQDPTIPTVTTGRLRVVNSIFQGADAASAVPVAIDVSIDGSTAAPGIAGLAAMALSPGDASGDGLGTHSGAGAIFTAAGYRDIVVGDHDFIARVSGTSGPASDFFRNSDGSSEAVPRQYVGIEPRTLVLAGIIPPAGTPAGPGAVAFAFLLDSPFPSSGLTAGSKARVQVINAAPMADTTGAGQGTEITSTFDDGAGGITTAVSPYRDSRSSPYSDAFISLAPASYTFTVATGSFVLYTTTIALTKGEVRTLVVQSTGYSAVPGPGNTTVKNLLDNKW